MATIKSKAALQAVKTSTHKINNADWQDFVESAVLKLSSTGYANPAMLGSGTASSVTYLRGDGVWAEVEAGTTLDVSAFIETLLDDPDAATARATLGLGTISTLDSSLFVVKTSTVADGASAVAHYLDSPSYVTAGAKLLSLRNAGVEKFSVGYDGQTQAYTFAASLYLWSNGGVYGQVFNAPNRTVVASAPMFEGAQTWNNALTTFKAFTIDVTDTASASGSLLADFMVGGTSKFSVGKGGSFTASPHGSAGLYFEYTGGYNYRLLMTNSGGTPAIALNSAADSYINGGNVGVGTASPTSPLHVSSAAGTIVTLTDSTYAQRYALITGQNGGANWGGLQAVDGAQLRFGVDNGLPGNTPAIVIQSATYGTANRVGIGTSDPTSKLDVAGDVRASSNGFLINTGLGYSLGVASNPAVQVVRFGGQNIAELQFWTGYSYTNLSIDGVAGGQMTLAPVWNAGATTFTGFKVNVTDTASASGSLLADFMVGGVSKASIDKRGYVSAYRVNIDYNGVAYGTALSVNAHYDAGPTVDIRNNGGDPNAVALFVHGNGSGGTGLHVDNGNVFLCSTTGRVGIGTTSPTELLDFGTSGGIAVRGSATNSVGAGNTGGLFFSYNQNPVYGARIEAVHTGSVGKPLTLAGYPLRFASSHSGLEFAHMDDGGYWTLEPLFNNGGTTYTAFKVNVTDTASDAASLLMDLQVGGTSQTAIYKNGEMRVCPASAGHVGLGLGYLQVSYSSDVRVFLAQNADAFFGVQTGSANSGGIRLQEGNGSSYSYIGTGLSGSLILNGPGGNVGIGTTSPVATLHVNAINPVLRISNTAAGSFYTHYIRPGVAEWSVGQDGADEDKFKIAASVAFAYTRFTITSAGNVGIGTTNPGSYKLYVNGATLSIGALVTLDDAYVYGQGRMPYGSRWYWMNPGETAYDAFIGRSGVYQIEVPWLFVGGAGTPVATSGAVPGLRLDMTWNAGAETFTGLKVNVTDTASASGSLLMDLQVGGVSKFSVEKDGDFSFTGAVSGTYRLWDSGYAGYAGRTLSRYGGGSSALWIAGEDNSDATLGFWGAGHRGTFTASGDYSWYLNPTSAYGSGHIFLNNSSTGNVLMGVGGGKVGVGVSVPYATFQVRGNAGIYSIGSTNGGSPVGGSLYLGDENFPSASYFNSAPGLSAVYEGGSGVSSGLAFYVYTGSPNSRTERFRISGVVGGIFASVPYYGGDGTAGSPTFSFTNATNYGMYYDGAGLSFAIASSRIVYFDTSGLGTGKADLDLGTITSARPTLSVGQTWNNALVTFKAFVLNVTDTASASGSLLMDLQVGGIPLFSVRKDGLCSSGVGFAAPSFTAYTNAVIANATYLTSFGPQLGAGVALHWADAGGLGSTSDLFLYRDAAGVLAQRNGTNGQGFRIYNTYTSGSEYERIVFQWAANELVIGTDAAGTGVARGINMYNGTTGTGIALRGYVNLSGTVVPSVTNGAFEFGLSTNRWGAGYFGGNTVTASAPVLNLTQTWNAGGVTFTGILANITDTASAFGSLLMDLQVGGVSKVKIRNDGFLSATALSPAGTAVNSPAWTATGLLFGPTDTLAWADGANSGNPDVMLKRVSAGILGVYQGDGTTGGTFKTSVLLMGANLGCWDTTTGNLQLHRDANAIGWSDGDASPGNAGWSLVLYKDAAGVLALKNGTNAQAFRVYETTAVPDYVEIGHVASIAYVIKKTNGSLTLGVNNSGQWEITSGHFRPSGSGAWDFGDGAHLVASGWFGGNTITASRPVLNLTQTWNNGAANFFGILADFTDTASGVSSFLMDLRVGGLSTFSVRKDGYIQANYFNAVGFLSAGAGSRLSSPVDGVFLMRNAAETGFTRLCFGGTSASEPAWKRIGASIGLRLADDSAYTNAIINGLALSADATTTIGAFLNSPADKIARVSDWNGTSGAAVELLEMTAPAAPAANTVRLYAEDNGAGKTRLMALFPSGAAQQVAIEP